MSEVKVLADKIKPTLDRVRAMADKANAAVQKINGTFGGTLVKAIPGLGTYVTALVQGCQGLDILIDAIDTAVDEAS